ncbi:MAG: hypothetical protein IKH54_07340 [Bacilli bacterium]|nr:hypothetical protein [Bacilli bacterium]
MIPKFKQYDVLKYGAERYFIIDVVTDLGDKNYYFCCEATLDAQLDFNNVAAFEITVDQNNEEMIRMIDPDSENFKTLAVYELDQVMSELYPQYNEKLEELLDLEEE